MLTSVAIMLVPAFLKPLIAPVIAIPKARSVEKIRHMLEPDIERRLRMVGKGAASEDGTAPNDFLQWQIQYMSKAADPSEYHPKRIADYMTVMQFAAIPTSAQTCANAVYDIMSSPEKDWVLSEMRKELEEIRAADKGSWTRTSVQRMVKTDAFIRESMRLSTLQNGAFHRVVVAKDGVTLPDGLHIKQGNMVSIPSYPIQRGADYYSEPDIYFPRRFFPNETKTSSDEATKDDAKDRKTTSTNIVDTSLTFLNYGHGKHACPGRFFAANELKLIFAYMATHYDIQPLSERPGNLELGSFVAANPNGVIKVRRRKI